MSKTNRAKRLIEDMERYAKRYSCTIQEAFCDRDYPLSYDEIREGLEAGGYRYDAIIDECSPDSDESVREMRAEFDLSVRL